MPSSTPSSASSSTFRIDWRPSRWLVVGLALLGTCAALALVLSDLPPGLAVPAALAAFARGAWLARREHRRGPCAVVRSGAGWQRLDADRQGWPLQAVRWRLQGPFAVLRARDVAGRRCHFVWAPDTLCASQRRLLRLSGVVSSRSDNPLPAVAA